MHSKRSPKDMSDDEVLAELMELVKEMNEVAAQTERDIRAGKYVDPATIDWLDVDDEEIDRLRELNEKRLD
jgi:hypothetical protein